MQKREEAIRVLHVDDDPDFLDIAATFLEREYERFDVKTTTDVRSGLERLGEETIDCVVSDYDMPDSSGIDFLEAVRAKQPEIPFILYTGKGSEEVASEAISAGVTDYIQKRSGTSQYTVLANRIQNAVEQYRSREAVNEAEMKLWQLAENTDDILYMVDSDWDELLFINGAYEEVWGGSRAALESDPRSFLENVHPDDREKAEASMERLSNGHPDQIEYRVITPDGDERWVRGDSTPILGEKGEVDRIVGWVRDITERKRRELETEQRRHQLEQILKTVPACVVLVDKSGAFTYANDRAEEVLGLEPDEVTDRTYNDPDWNITDLEGDPIPDEELPFRRVRDSGEPVYGVRHTIEWPDGRRKVLLVNGAPIFDEDGEVESTVFALTDITERRRQERQLERQNERFEYVEEVAEIGYWEIDATSGEPYETSLSDGVYRIHDLSRQASLNVEEGLGYYHPEHREAVRADVEAAITEGEPYDHEVRLITAEDRERWVHSVGEPVLKDGDVVTVRGVFQDITERKEKERELSRQNERLDEFASVVSHDLRNPLRTAQGKLVLADEECSSSHLDDASAAVDRSLELIEDLLKLAREGDRVSEQHEVNVTEMVEACWRTLADDDATLNLEADPHVQADPIRFRQLLENLLANALEHGGQAVTVRIGSLEDEAGLYVADDGSGIPEDIQDDIFEPGYSTSESGTGFGLNIVREIAEGHGWTLRVCESADGGARFEIIGVEWVDDSE
ncbi:MAG: PAS domain S-box protein [Salinirussus sp.]